MGGTRVEREGRGVTSQADRFTVLDLARDAVTRRAAAYGEPAPHFTRAARLWSVLLGIEIEAYQVALCLGALKLARLVEAPGHADSAADLAGYAAIGHELATRAGTVRTDSTTDERNQ